MGEGEREILPSLYESPLEMTRLLNFLLLLALTSGFVSSDEISTVSPIENEDEIDDASSTNPSSDEPEEAYVPCQPVVNGREKCIEIGFKESVCGIPVITESDITCPSSSNPTIFVLPGNPNERFLPARFMICMAGGRWMISGLDGSFGGDDGLSSPIHVVCFPEIPQEEQPDPFDELDDDEIEEKFGDKKEEKEGVESGKTEL